MVLWVFFLLCVYPIPSSFSIVPLAVTIFLLKMCIYPTPSSFFIAVESARSWIRDDEGIRGAVRLDSEKNGFLSLLRVDGSTRTIGPKCSVCLCAKEKLGNTSYNFRSLLVSICYQNFPSRSSRWRSVFISLFWLVFHSSLGFPTDVLFLLEV